MHPPPTSEYKILGAPQHPEQIFADHAIICPVTEIELAHLNRALARHDTEVVNTTFNRY